MPTAAPAALSPPRAATVVGAGIIGLTTALVLEERGVRVRIVAAAAGDDTTSAVAGAIWHPFLAEPPELVTRWARVTRLWLEAIAREHPAAGVDIVTYYEATDHDTPPAWADAAQGLRRVPDAERRATRDPALLAVADAPVVWALPVPRCEPGLFMPWISGRLRARVETRRLASLDDADEFGGEVVFNCTGLGAGPLTGDTDLRGVLGQVSVVRPGELPLDAGSVDERRADNVYYTIPRRGTVVVGGVARPTAPADASQPERPQPVDEELQRSILLRAAERGLRPGEVVRTRASLRPARSRVRVELDNRRTPEGTPIVHNYGHGGSGWTLCRGCAEDAVMVGMS